VDAVKLGRIIRALRINRGWRQQDLGDAAGVSQDEISLVERGHCQGVPLRTIERIAAAFGAATHIVVQWRNGDLDRLLDEGHASLVGRVAAVLDATWWVVLPEVTFALYRDRGSIDILAWHAATATLLVEVKTELTSIEETLRKHDMKVRVAPQVALERVGWRRSGSGADARPPGHVDGSAEGQPAWRCARPGLFDCRARRARVASGTVRSARPAPVPVTYDWGSW
jgi:transcriptional regulator with XRE-family HTH domain